MWVRDGFYLGRSISPRVLLPRQPRGYRRKRAFEEFTLFTLSQVRLFYGFSSWSWVLGYVMPARRPVLCVSVSPLFLFSPKALARLLPSVRIINPYVRTNWGRAGAGWDKRASILPADDPIVVELDILLSLTGVRQIQTHSFASSVFPLFLTFDF